MIWFDLVFRSGLARLVIADSLGYYYTMPLFKDLFEIRIDSQTVGDHFESLDIDECAEGTHDCRLDEECEDLSPMRGYYKCTKKCPPGLDQTSDGQCVGKLPNSLTPDFSLTRCLHDDARWILIWLQGFAAYSEPHESVSINAPSHMRFSVFENRDLVRELPTS